LSADLPAYFLFVKERGYFLAYPGDFFFNSITKNRIVKEITEGSKTHVLPERILKNVPYFNLLSFLAILEKRWRRLWLRMGKKFGRFLSICQHFCDNILISIDQKIFFIKFFCVKSATNCVNYMEMYLSV